MNRLTIKLRQHTPLIHFQHDQVGATLRATEVKPKLDKFILTQLGNGNYDKGIERAKGKRWFIGNTNALDYKLRFTSSEKPDISEINNIRLYFGNLAKGDNNSEYKKFSFLKNFFQMEIFTLQNSLMNEIRGNVDLSVFFAQNNFGSRQSKGFGSFYLDKSSEGYKSIESNYRFVIDVSRPDNWQQLFETIDVFYKSLRSGINLKGKQDKTLFYFKSLLFLYFKSKNIQWDKKSIKERFFNSDLEKDKREHKNPDILTFRSAEKRLVKDLLGLSTNENWRIPYRSSVIKKSDNDSIDRFKSPVILKPIQISEKKFAVYIFFNVIDQNFLNQQFSVEVRDKKLNLSTPAEFSVNDFFKWILNEENFDIHKHVDLVYHSHPQFKTLEKIYEQLREYLKIKENVKS